MKQSAFSKAGKKQPPVLHDSVSALVLQYFEDTAPYSDYYNDLYAILWEKKIISSEFLFAEREYWYHLRKAVNDAVHSGNANVCDYINKRKQIYKLFIDCLLEAHACVVGYYQILYIALKKHDSPQEVLNTHLGSDYNDMVVFFSNFEDSLRKRKKLPAEQIDDKLLTILKEEEKEANRYYTLLSDKSNSIKRDAKRYRSEKNIKMTYTRIGIAATIIGLLVAFGVVRSQQNINVQILGQPSIKAADTMHYKRSTIISDTVVNVID